MSRISLRLRLTILSVLLLTVCCVGLTVVLNLNANSMADEIEMAALVTAAPSIGDGGSEPEPDTLPLSPSVQSQRTRTDFRKDSVIYMLLVIAAGGCLTWFLVGSSLKPLKALSERMKSCTAENLSQQIPVPPNRDEVAELTESFNHMSLQLDRTFEAQRRFAQSTAHELRTPLAVLKTKIDVFQKRRDRSRSEYDELIAALSKQTDRLSELVRDLLELTDTDGVATPEPVALLPLMQQTVSELSALAGEKQVCLSLTGSEVTVEGNRLLLGRVFFNLVENAIKYNRPGGSVDITVSDTPAVTVADTGIGIPPEALDAVFEPFYRVDKSRSRQMGGAGLGLATVKSIVQQHGGRIELSSAPGEGSVFTVYLN